MTNAYKMLVGKPPGKGPPDGPTNVTNNRRKLHNKKLHNLYNSPTCNIITVKKCKWKEMDYACNKHRPNAFKILVGKSKGKGTA
jgi:hypothetical protein